MCVIAHTALTSRSTTAMSGMQKVRIGMTDSTFFYLSRECAAARAADAAFVACDAALVEASSARVDGELVVQGAQCRARIET